MAHRILLLLIFTGITLFSCQEEDFFDKEEKIATRVTDPLSSVEKLDQVVNGTYWMLIGRAESGQFNPHDNYKTWNVLGSDLVTITDPPRQDYLNQTGVYYWYERTRNHQLRSQIERTWSLSYSNISNVNLVIQTYEDALPGVPFPNDEDLDELPRVVGEAYFLRGFHYWILNQLYGPAYEPNGDNSDPSILLKPRNSLGLSDLNVPQSTVEDVYQALLADFDSAAANLPADVGLGRVSRPAAEAMLSRVHLEMNNFELAAQYAGNVIDNYSFILEEEPIEAFNKGQANSSDEVIWEYQWAFGHQFSRHGFITPVPSSHFQWVERRSFGYSGAIDTQLRECALSHSICQRIGWMDQNLQETAEAANDKRYQQVYHRANPGTDTRLETIIGETIPEPYIWIFKDCRAAAETNGGTDFSDDLYNPQAHVPLIRLPEMYLNRAIARLQLGDESGALSDINAVRERAWDEAAGSYVPLTPGNLGVASSIEEAIEIERVKEFAGEGDRLFYLKAMKMEVPPGDRPNFETVPYTDESLFWPMPPNEEDLNEAIDS